MGLCFSMSNTTTKRIQRECREVVIDGEMADLGITIEIIDEGAFSHIKVRQFLFLRLEFLFSLYASSFF